MVRCHFDENGGWIVFQRNVDAETNFDVGLDPYKNGFGNPHGIPNFESLIILLLIFIIRATI